jgi:hypothetical protein
LNSDEDYVGLSGFHGFGDGVKGIIHYENIREIEVNIINSHQIVILIARRAC